jgi:hypothetical protein
MARQNIPMVPDENRIESRLANIQPVPGEQFHQKMKQADWGNEHGQSTGTKNLHFKFGFTVTTLVLVSILLVPPGTGLDTGACSVLPANRLHDLYPFKRGTDTNAGSRPGVWTAK